MDLIRSTRNKSFRYTSSDPGCDHTFTVSFSKQLENMKLASNIAVLYRHKDIQKRMKPDAQLCKKLKGDSLLMK